MRTRSCKFQRQSAGACCSLDMVSLMPNKTWKNHGMRPDLCEMLDALKPSFFRFPGGCWVEGDDMAHMNKWKHTIGDVSRTHAAVQHLGYMATQRAWLPRVSATVRGPGGRAAVLHQRRHVAQGKCADAADGAVGAGCARRDRVCQRAGRLAVGRPAGEERASRAVQSEVLGDRQRKRRRGVSRAVAACSSRRSRRSTPRSCWSRTTGRAGIRVAHARGRRRALLQHARVLHAAGEQVRRLRPQGAEDFRGRVRRDAERRAGQPAGGDRRGGVHDRH